MSHESRRGRAQNRNNDPKLHSAREERAHTTTIGTRCAPRQRGALLPTMADIHALTGLKRTRDAWMGMGTSRSRRRTTASRRHSVLSRLETGLFMLLSAPRRMALGAPRPSPNRVVGKRCAPADAPEARPQEVSAPSARPAGQQARRCGEALVFTPHRRPAAATVLGGATPRALPHAPFGVLHECTKIRWCPKSERTGP